jgi:exodeoxyribonuclease-3
VKVVSWNVNGLRACARKGFCRWLEECGAEIVGVQEVRARLEDLPDALRAPPGWHAHFAAARRAGYSGVGLYSRCRPDRIETQLGIPRFDREGRLQIARFGRLAIANVYFPKGSGTNRDNSRVPFKLAFYRALFARVERLRGSGLRVLVIGDFNTAHREIDLARPRANRGTSGFLPEERAEIDRWLAAGWVDVFRRLHPGAGGQYTWWRQWGGAREKNVGWRIDYVLASRAAMRFVRGAFLWPDVRGSDHCPAGVELDPGVLDDEASDARKRRDAAAERQRPSSVLKPCRRSSPALRSRPGGDSSSPSSRRRRRSGCRRGSAPRGASRRRDRGSRWGAWRAPGRSPRRDRRPRAKASRRASPEAGRTRRLRSRRRKRAAAGRFRVPSQHLLRLGELRSDGSA